MMIFFQTEDDENAQVNMAKKFLDGVGMGEESMEALAARISREAELSGRKIHHEIAKTCEFSEPVFMKGHKLPVTCVAIATDEKYCYTGGKDCAIIRWDLETGQKDVYPGGRKQFDCGGHFEQVLSITVAEEENLVITGGADKTIRLWDVRAPKGKAVGEMRGHSGAVTGVVAEPGNTRQLFSSSKDRTLRVWNLSMRSFVSLMCGHTDDVTYLDILIKDKPLSVSTDRTVRLWKQSNDSHYVFHSTAPGTAHGAGFESCSFINAGRFITGGVDGSLALWSSAFKKPLTIAANAHGMSPVSAVAAVRFSDLAFSASCDGVVRTWRADGGQAALKAAMENGSEKMTQGQHKRLLASGLLESVGELKVGGFVNAMAVSARGGLLVAAGGKEPRLGRWEVDKEPRNGIHVVKLEHHAVGK
eukprot:GDKK01060621.1.p1 GENE.GDKK01060621.1~~GDKK01060621.1.p1  ORF type:complete len:417 (-),score=79.05 GDKK01060621.1:174-1424(-)